MRRVLSKRWMASLGPYHQKTFKMFFKKKKHKELRGSVSDHTPYIESLKLFVQRSVVMVIICS